MIGPMIDELKAFMHATDQDGEVLDADGQQRGEDDLGNHEHEADPRISENFQIDCFYISRRYSPVILKVTGSNPTRR